MNWNIKSKRFLVTLIVNCVWAATLAMNMELFKFMTPYAVGFNAAYCGFESWKPSGIGE
jgi:hypothetical protein